MDETINAASFRDPSGYVFEDNGILRRIINPVYFKQYNSLKSSGFYETLINKSLLIAHQETSKSHDKIVITPELIPFITNPYEWSFDQYKHAALLTLQIHKYALSKNYILKDASAYNVTFYNGKPIFIDTLSFDFYVENTPWRAYKQFIKHFFSPLILAKYFGTEMFKMLQTHIDGIPITLASKLLPFKTKFSPTIQTNIHLLAKMEEKHNDNYNPDKKTVQLTKKAQYNIIDNLFEFVKELQLNDKSEWGEYYKKINYDEKTFELKKDLIKDWVENLKPKKVLDIGGNDGTFSRVIAKNVDHIIVSDIDSNAVNYNYQQIKVNKETNILPFVSDLLQPSPGIGFNNVERNSFIERLKVYSPDVTLALALIHHITLSGNVPFLKSAEFFSNFSNYLIIEFPKRSDSWVNSLLVRKREFINHFDFYNEDDFENAYLNYFKLIRKKEIMGTERILYLFVVK